MLKNRAPLALVADDDVQFTRFWLAYPRKDAKLAARKAWTKLNPDVALVDLMIHALIWQILAHRWDRDKKEYAPHAATWLNGRRWEDEGPTPDRTLLSPAISDPMQAWLRKKVPT